MKASRGIASLLFYNDAGPACVEPDADHPPAVRGRTGLA